MVQLNGAGQGVPEVIKEKTLGKKTCFMPLRPVSMLQGYYETGAF